MDNNFLTQKTASEIANELAKKIKEKRRKLKISQTELAKKSSVSLGSVKRFENQAEISLKSLIKIAIVLGLDKDFDDLFAQKTYASIDEVINE